MIFSVKHFEFFAFISLIYHLADARHLWLNTGIIEGRTVSVWPHEVDVYKGIPFAEKPVGNRRFQLPEPKRPWHGILNTTEYSRPCISNTTQTTSPQSNVSEDCLYLNVFADARCQSRLCPILFYIHGGDFYYDSAVMFNDTEIINKYASDEIIFVIPAYRMGIFGFLDLGKELDSTAYNIGFYDILLALRWVQQEGLNFGGDVNRITIVGNSGGAMAVQYLLVSPAVESGAFQQAVMLSGVAGLRPHANRKLTEIVTSAVKCDQDNNGTLLEIDEQLSCLRSTSARALTIATKESEAEWISISPQTDPVLFPAKDMATLLEERLKSMPMLITTTPDEMVLETRNRTNFEMCLSFFSSFGYEMNETANACSKFYEKRDPDAMTKDALHSFAMKVAIANRQRGQQSYVGVFSQLNHTHHANDMTYFFGLHPIANMTENDKLMNVWYPQMIKNFIKTGKPLDDWKPVDSFGRNFYWMNFELYGNDNKTFKDRPHLVEGQVYEANIVNLWLKDLANVESLTKQKYGVSSNRLQSTATKSTQRQSKITSNGNLWSAFWAILSLLIVVGTSVLLVTCLRLIFKYQNNAYTLTPGGEKTILSTKSSRRYL